MTTMLDRPGDLGADHWSAIEAHANRLERARRDGDLTLVIGSAKDLVETIAKIVLELSGEVAASNADLPGLLAKAHLALDRLPGQGAAVETPVRNIAQGAKTIISQLPELRNRFGTGHGRVLTPQVDEELALLCLDAALLWARWGRCNGSGSFSPGGPSAWSRPCTRASFTAATRGNDSKPCSFRPLTPQISG